MDEPHADSERFRPDVAVRDSDAWIHRLSYNITLLGRIVFSRS